MIIIIVNQLAEIVKDWPFVIFPPVNTIPKKKIRMFKKLEPVMLVSIYENSSVCLEPVNKSLIIFITYWIAFSADLKMLHCKDIKTNDNNTVPIIIPRYLSVSITYCLKLFFWLNTSKNNDEILKMMNVHDKKILRDRNIKFFTIDASKIASDSGIPGKISAIMEVIIFKLGKIVSFEFEMII